MSEYVRDIKTMARRPGTPRRLTSGFKASCSCVIVGLLGGVVSDDDDVDEEEDVDSVGSVGLTLLRLVALVEVGSGRIGLVVGRSAWERGKRRRNL